MSKVAKAPAKTVMLKTVAADGEAHGGFKWPLEVGAVVEAPDWNLAPVCGGGLHGLVDGLGDWSLLDWSLEAKALLVEADSERVVRFDGKAKAPAVVLREVGTLPALLCRVVCDPRKVVDLVKKCADTAASGNYATLAASGNGAAVSCAGIAGVVSAGVNGAISAVWHDGKRLRIAVGYVGEDGIEPLTPYRVEAGKWVRA